MKIITDKNKIEEIFARGEVVDVLPSKKELIKIKKRNKIVITNHIFHLLIKVKQKKK
jgi:hypothetical protein